jgi:16S rRNA (guanine1207-N2)-methyltransferase
MIDVDSPAGIPAGIYGAPPAQLAPALAHARQLSPLFPGADDLAATPAAAFASIVMAAPAGTLERRYAIAMALRALAPGEAFTALAANDKGGLRLAKELAAFGCAVEEASKSRWRICATRRPAVLIGLDEAVQAGGPQLVEGIGLWSQPGVFSWDRIDPGSRILAARLPALAGRGADLGCGVGFLALAVLRADGVQRLDLIDIDRRAIAAARANVIDPRAHFHWRDATGHAAGLKDLDFVVMNPPFHAAAIEDKSLGLAFIRRASQLLRPGGVCWLVANRHLPYEAALAAHFTSVRLDHEADGYKVFEAKA